VPIIMASVVIWLDESVFGEVVVGDVLLKVAHRAKALGQRIQILDAQACDSGGLRQAIVIDPPLIPEAGERVINGAVVEGKTGNNGRRFGAVGESTRGCGVNEKSVRPRGTGKRGMVIVEQRKFARKR